MIDMIEGGFPFYVGVDEWLIWICIGKWLWVTKGSPFRE